MRVLPSEDQRELAVMLRRLFAAECPPSVARAHRDLGTVPVALWKALANAGMFGLAVAEQYGGSGGSLSDVGVFAVEAGRALCPTTVHSTTLAALAIAGFGNDAARTAWLPGLCSGEHRATTALWGARDAAVIGPTLSARRASGGWRLDGTVDFVIDADGADLLVASADTGGGTVVVVVEMAASGVCLEPLSLMGGFRASRMVCDDVVVPDQHVVADDTSAGELRRVANMAVALFSLDLVGVAEAVIDKTVEYTSSRTQFGRAIAAFQAAQHIVADMHIAASAARLAGHAAMFRLGNGDIATRETAIARMYAAAAAKRATLDAHQLHGGMGYVTQTDLHLWSERARVLSTLGGGADIAAGWLDDVLWQEKPR